jgi:hypothetical protein
MHRIGEEENVDIALDLNTDRGVYAVYRKGDEEDFNTASNSNVNRSLCFVYF